MKNRVMGNGPTTGMHFPSYTSIKDSGYTKICPRCAERFGDVAAVIGKARELESVVCQNCEDIRKELSALSAREQGWKGRK